MGEILWRALAVLAIFAALVWLNWQGWKGYYWLRTGKRYRANWMSEGGNDG